MMGSFVQDQKRVCTTEFLRALFDASEFTCFSATPKGVSLNPYWDPNPTENAFFSINPMDRDKTRSDSAVILYRNILIEMDKIPLEQQDQHITEIGMGYTTAVYSGSKSIHYIISLEDALTDESVYRALVKRVYKAVGNDLVDQANKNPSRFSRLPEHTRLDTGNEQKLLAVNSRVPNSTLEEWLNERGAPQEELWDNLTPEPRSTFKNYSRLYGATKNFLMFGAPKGEWNPRLFKASADLCRCGYSIEEATGELKQVTGHLDFADIKTIESAYTNELGKIK